MPIQVTAYAYLRANYLKWYIKGEPTRKNWEQALKPEERESLRRVVEEIDSLNRSVVDSRDLHKPIQNKYIVFPRPFPQEFAESSNPKRTSELFHEIHDILKDHSVDAIVYRNLGGAFKELGIEPNPELKIAIDHGTRLIEQILSTLGLRGPYLLYMKASAVIRENRSRSKETE